MFDWHLVEKVFLIKCTNLKKHVLSFFKPLVKMDITFNQRIHFGQVEPFEKSYFFVVKEFDLNYAPNEN
jgi:hypothetical protein